jgi:hypothetical protein
MCTDARTDASGKLQTMLDVAEETSDNMWNRSRGIWPPLTQLVLTHRFPSGRHYSRLRPSGFFAQMLPSFIYVRLHMSAFICYHLAFLPRCHYCSSMPVCPCLLSVWHHLSFTPRCHCSTSMHVCPDLLPSAHHLSFTPRCNYSTSMHVCPCLLPSATI